MGHFNSWDSEALSISYDFLQFLQLSSYPSFCDCVMMLVTDGYCFSFIPCVSFLPWEVCWDREMALTWSDDSTLKVWDLKARPGGSPMAGTEEDRTNLVQSWKMVLKYA